jgi:hypothetical protein
LDYATWHLLHRSKDTGLWIVEPDANSLTVRQIFRVISRVNQVRVSPALTLRGDLLGCKRNDGNFCPTLWNFLDVVILISDNREVQVGTFFIHAILEHVRPVPFPNIAFPLANIGQKSNFMGSVIQSFHSVQDWLEALHELSPGRGVR